MGAAAVKMPTWRRRERMVWQPMSGGQGAKRRCGMLLAAAAAAVRVGSVHTPD
jgi:hypothetical protein